MKKVRSIFVSKFCTFFWLNLNEESLSICNGRWNSHTQKNENQIKLVFVVGWIWKFTQMSGLFLQTCLWSFVCNCLLFFEIFDFFNFCHLVCPTYRQSLRIGSDLCNSHTQKIENQIKLGFVVGWIWKLTQMSGLFLQTCLQNFVSDS